MAINGSINLLKYVGARKVSISGEKGIFIPVESNPSIFVGDKGAYASVRIVEHESSFGDKTYTHFIAAALPKKQREEMEAQYGKDAVKQCTPILGNAEEYGNNGGGSFEEATEDRDSANDGYNANYNTKGSGKSNDDLPF